MERWNLGLFTEAVEDFERAQYRILSNLQQTRRQFSSNRIYPFLAELVALHGSLRGILQNSEAIRESLPGIIREINLEKGEAIVEKPEFDNDQLAAVEELIRWALPHITDAIEEGTAVFEFVEEHLHLEEVGIVPSYVQEGYLFVPDREANELHILQYSMSIFAGASERYRSLRTTHVKSVPERGVRWSPQTLKLSLMEERRELPNPATYNFDFDLDFPYESTVLPVAKRKLMRYLYSEGGLA